MSSSMQEAPSLAHAPALEPHAGDPDGGGPAGAERPLSILAVAFHFPPIAAAGTHRTLNFVRELSARGHRIGVVTTSNFEGLRREDASLARIPAGVEVARAAHVDPFLTLARLRSPRGATSATAKENDSRGAPSVPGGWRAVLDYLSRLHDLPDRYASWIPSAVLSGIKLGRAIDADVLYTTAPPFSAHVAGLLLATALDLPWVADLRDPWATNPFKTNPWRSLRALDAGLESRAIARADRVILNTEAAERSYRRRYGAAGRFTTIYNGIAPELLQHPRGAPPEGDVLELLHVGTIYGRRSPLALARALKRLATEKPRLFERLRLRQIGPVEDGGRLAALLRELGIERSFAMEPPVSHAEAFAASTRAHGLLLLGVSGDEPEVQIPAKLYEYLAAGRPIVALAKSGGAILTVLARAQAPYAAADPDDDRGIARALERFAQMHDAAPQGAAELSSGALAFSYPALARRLEAELQRAVERRR